MTSSSGCPRALCSGCKTSGGTSDGRRTYFYRLAGAEYEEVESSIAFPVLTNEDLSRFVEQSKTEGQTATLAAFRQTLRARRPS